jgi:hypothetical protein
MRTFPVVVPQPFLLGLGIVGVQQRGKIRLPYPVLWVHVPVLNQPRLDHQREAISTRTRAAMAAAKARGQVFGNPNGAAPFRRAGKGNVAAVEAIVARADAHARDVLPVIEDVRASGITSLKGIAGALNRRGILTPQRGKWTATSVRRLLARGHQ